MKRLSHIVSVTSLCLGLAFASACATDATMAERSDDDVEMQDSEVDEGRAQMAGHGAPERLTPAEHAAKIQEALGLTDEKTAEVQAVFENVEPKMAALKQRGKALHDEMRELHESGDDEGKKAKKEEMHALHEEGRALHGEQMAQLEAILSPEEVEELKALAEEHHRGGKGMHRGKGKHHKMMMADPAEHARKLQEELGLDDEQTAKAEAIFAAAREKMKPLHERKKAAHHGEGLSEDEKAELKAEMKAIHAEVKGELDELLNDEQRAKLRELKERHHGEKGAHHGGGHHGGGH